MCEARFERPWIQHEAGDDHCPDADVEDNVHQEEDEADGVETMKPVRYWALSVSHFLDLGKAGHTVVQYIGDTTSSHGHSEPRPGDVLHPLSPR